MKTFQKLYHNSVNIGEFASGYFKRLKNILDNININSINKLEEEFEDSRKNGNTIFVIGNGGSATTASSMANDIGFDIIKRTSIKDPFRILSLTDNNSIITAVGNDIGYENLFISQLKLHYRDGDKLLVISASGNSKNILLAADWVKERGGKIIGFLGFDGGKLLKIADLAIHIKTEEGEFGPVEDMHLIINHVLAHWFTEKLK
mgnify:FL=1